MSENAGPIATATRRTSLAGALVREARRRGRLSQRELARRAEVSRSTIAEIELGARDPGLTTLRRVLNGAGVDLEVQLVDRDDHDAVLEESLQHLDPRERARLEAGLERFVSGLANGLATSRPLRPTS